MRQGTNDYTLVMFLIPTGSESLKNSFLLWDTENKVFGGGRHSLGAFLAVVMRALGQHFLTLCSSPCLNYPFPNKFCMIQAALTFPW